MTVTKLSRRGLLKASLFSLPGTTWLIDVGKAQSSGTAATSDSQGPALFVSAARRGTDDFVAAVFDDRGQIVSTVPLPARAHGAASHPASGHACIFARRPGLFMSTFTLQQSAIHRVINAVSGRHFYGHGAYSSSGRHLYATENDYIHGRGVVGVYDTQAGYTRVAEFDSGGIGPHEMLRAPGSDILLVANGGIQTHPDSGREKLNIDRMQPSICILDAGTGKILGKHRITDSLHQVSIRHMACADNGIAWFAGQYEGDADRPESIAGQLDIHQSMDSFNGYESSEGMSWLSLPDELLARTQYYLSSVAVVGKQVFFTSSHGGLAFSVDRQSAELVEQYSMMDCSGVASELRGEGASTPIPNAGGANRAMIEDGRVLGSGALLTSGTGELVRLFEGGIGSLTIHPLQWDNHVYRL